MNEINEFKAALLSDDHVQRMIKQAGEFAATARRFDASHYDSIAPDMFIKLCEWEIARCAGDDARASRLKARISTTRYFCKEMPNCVAETCEYSRVHNTNTREAMKALIIVCIAIVDECLKGSAALSLAHPGADIAAVTKEASELRETLFAMQDNESATRWEWFGLGDFAPRPLTPEEIEL